MKCVVINGTEVRGCTYNLKEIFLDELKPTELKEFYLPKDGPDFCKGCKVCFVDSETKCPHFDKVNPIWQAMLDADLIVFAYPVYVFRAPGQVKALLDHFGVHWIAHRPNPEMFSKTVAIITQSARAPNYPAQKDVKINMQWLGVSKIKKIGLNMMEEAHWDKLPENRKKILGIKIRNFARSFYDLKPEKESLMTKALLLMMKKVQQGILKNLGEEELTPDLKHWIDHGWIIDNR